MRKAQAALVEAEKVMQDVLAVISVAKESRVRVEPAELKPLVDECKRVHVVLQDAVRAGEVAPAPEKASRKRAKTAKALVQEEDGRASSEVAASSQRPKRGQQKQKEEAKVRPVASVAERPKRGARPKPAEDVEDEEDEELAVVASRRERKSARVEVVDQQVAVVPAPVKKQKLKNGAVTRGPKGELVFYVARNEKSVVECPVYGKPQEEAFGMLCFFCACF